MIIKGKKLVYFVKKRTTVMRLEEKTVKKNYIYQGKILTLRKDDVSLSDGSLAIREIIEHSGGACVVYAENGKLLFVKQYRYAYGECVLEIPAGKLNAGEDPKLAGIRELEEEAGIRVKDATLLFVAYPSPGYTNEGIYIYQAQDGEKTATHLDEGEFLDVIWIDENRVREMLQTGEIKDAKTIIGLQAYFLNKK